MVLRTQRIVSVVFLLVNISCIRGAFPVLENSRMLMEESHHSVDGIARGLKFFRNRPGTLTIDVILGVLIVKANLEWILDGVHQNPSLSNELEKLIQRCNDVIDLNENKNYPILRKKIWNRAAKDLKLGHFNVEDYQEESPKFDSCESIDLYMMRGTPENSDFCMNELINSDCNVSETCWFSETNKMPYSGYKTTHRLLYFFVASQLQCEEKHPEKFFALETTKQTLCQQIFSEAKKLQEEPHSQLTRDLFLEQIALCGLEGYEDFAPYVWRKNVRSWQNRRGCFEQVEFEYCQTDGIRMKRTDTTVDGCHTHVTAVGLASLAFFLRCTIKGAFNLY